MSTAATFSTPVRHAAAAVSELSNESPLPTPPRAMHDLIRSGRAAVTGQRAYRDNDDDDDGEVREADGRTLINEMDEAIAAYMPPPLTDKLDRLEYRQRLKESSSPSARVGRAAVNGHATQRSFAATFGGASTGAGSGTTSAPTRRDSSGNTLGASLGTSLAGHRSALGSQMGISDAGSSKDGATTSGGNVLRTSNRRMAAGSSHDGFAGKEHIPSALHAEKENVDLIRPSERRSPAIDSDAGHERPSGTAFSRSTYRRTSAETGNPPSSQPAAKHREADAALRRSSDEGGGVSGSASRASTSNTVAGEQQHREGPLQTPAMQSGSRVLRSTHTATRTSAAPWSVGRPMKRLDPHSGLSRPAQRVVASSIEQEEEEEEEEERGERNKPSDLADRKMPTTIAEESDSATLIHSGGSGSAGRLREGDGKDERTKPPPEVPLGADEDEDEEDANGEAPRVAQPAGSRAGSRTAHADLESAQRRRAAINDIMAAKVPAEAVPRRVLAGIATEPEIGMSIPPTAAPLGQAALTREPASTGVLASEGDFMTLVRREADRQRLSPFIEQVRLKQSKDLETKFNGFKFKKVRKAGEGGFSTVWIVHGPYAAPHPSGVAGSYVDVPEREQAYFAMKQVTLKKMEQVSREEVLEECNLLQSLASKPDNEDFILRFFGWKSSTGSLKILLELGEHDFNQILRAQRLTHDQIVTYWHQMVQTVHFTHEQGNIVHTDLKPANFLMANGRLKLIDFGIAQKIPVGTIHIKRDAMIGTPNYMAPETVRAVKEGRGGRPSMALAAAAAAAQSTAGAGSSALSRVYKAGKASDVWALGCILYQMVYGRPPFEAHHGDDKLRQILDPKHVIDFPAMRYGPPRPRRAAQGCGAGNGTEEGEEEECDDDDDGELEPVDAELLDAMKLALTYSALDRITIPQLLRHPLLRALEQAYEQTDQPAPAEDAVPLTRDTLRDVLRKMLTFAINGELHEDNIDARADALFDNMLQRHRSAA